MRYMVGLVLALALAVLGCDETTLGPIGGSGGEAGMGGGGAGGDGGTGGTIGQEFPCTEQGIRDAIALGGGPHTFDCDGPKTVVTEAKIVIDKDVKLDGEDELRVHGDHENAVVSINEGVTAVLTRLAFSGGTCIDFACSPAIISNSGSLTLTASSLSNEPGQGGAGLENQGTATLTDCTLSSNLGGGVVSSGNLTVRNSTVSGNENWGIHVAGGTLMLTSTEVLRNGSRGILNEGMTTLVDCTVAENNNGGIYNAGTLTVLSTVLSNNNLAIDSGLTGGGIDNDGTVVVVNSTISGNTAARGGGVSGGPLTMVSTTISGNVAPVGAAISGISGLGGASSTARNSIIDGECALGQAIESLGGNVESPSDTCFVAQTTDQVSVPASSLQLGALADNGGPTETHALGAGSVAIDAIPAENCVDADGLPLTTDQRGFPRPAGAGCDVGAFELQP